MATLVRTAIFLWQLFLALRRRCCCFRSASALRWRTRFARFDFSGQDVMEPRWWVRRWLWRKGWRLRTANAVHQLELWVSYYSGFRKF